MTPKDTPPFNPSKTEVINCYINSNPITTITVNGTLVDLFALSLICKEKLDDKIKKILQSTLPENVLERKRKQLNK